MPRHIFLLLLWCPIALSFDEPKHRPRIPDGYVKWGDMVLPTSFFNANGTFEPRNAVPSDSQLWPGGEIPYVIDSSLAHIQYDIMTAMDEFHGHTCVRFRPMTEEDTDHVGILLDEGCYSLVGRNGNEQPLSLGMGCHDHGTIVHELMHAVGFYHEHNRSDRDKYITIHWECIEQGREDQFQACQPYENRLLGPFDYDSIMLYGSTGFSNDGGSCLTMTKKNGERLEETYNKPGLSAGDIRKINKLYRC